MKTNAHSPMFAIFLVAALNSFAQPSISLQPADQIVNQSFNATFRTTGSGAPPLSYQWFFGSNAIAGAITNVLTVTNAQPTNAGAYFAVVTNASGAATSRVAALTVVLPVALDPKLGANIRIGADPFTKTNLHQAEIHIDRSPTDPNLLLAAYQDALSSSSSDTALGASYAISKDGGFTWTGAFIPGVTKLSGGQLSFTADNVASIDLDGHLFLITIGFSNKQKFAQFFSASFDGGQTFSAPLAIATNDATTYPDKGWLAVNTFRDSPFVGRIAFTFTQTDDNSIAQTMFRYSDDQGRTWSSLKRVGALQAIGSQTFFLPDGTLAVLYRRYLDGGGLPNLGRAKMELAISWNGGDTFDDPRLVQDLSGKTYSVYPEIWDAVHFPSACSDRQAGVIYVAYQALGLNNRKSIMFTRSINKGQSWSPPVPVNDTPNNLDVFNPAIAVSPDGQHVTVEFYDKRNQTATSAGKNADLYLAESFDGGEHWEPNIRLSDFSSDLRKAAKRANEGAGVLLGDYQAIVPSLNFDTPGVAVWIDTRAGNNDPYAVRISRTKGTTFDTWRKLRFSTNDLANAALSGASADPDGDGISNLAEYAFGLEPVRTDTSPLKISKGPGNTTPTVLVAYERLAVLGDIQFSWQVSDNLVSWAAVSDEQEKITPGRDPSMQHVEASFPVGDRMKFFRLGITKVAPKP